MFRVTEAEADSIMAAPKAITATIEWKQVPNSPNWYEFQVPLDIDLPCKLVLHGNIHAALNRYSFVIVYNGVPIKRLDIGKQHRNPGGELVGEKHKHIWTDEFGDRYAYEPDDITTGADIKQVFAEFLKECNIEFDGQLPEVPPSQMELEINA